MTVATAELPPTAVRLELLDDLILTRLLVRPKNFGLAGLRKSLSSFFRDPRSSEEMNRQIEDLRTASLIGPRGLQLTDSGRDRALGFLGLAQLPPRATWQTIKARYLVPKALGHGGRSINAQQVDKFEHLAAVLLKSSLGVSVGKTLSEVLVALACRRIGVPETTDWNRVRREVISRLCGSEETLDSKRLPGVATRKLLNVSGKGIDGLRQLVFQGWTNGQSQVKEPVQDKAAEPFDLPAFANTVVKAARECPTGRFGPSKVFINHVWSLLSGEPGFPQMPLVEFKQRLVEAHLAGLLVLSRADMVPNMPTQDVEESETRYLSAEFHFIRTEEDRP